MKIAVIGAWHVHTQEYAQAILKNPQAQLACLWDDDQARGQAMAQTLGVPFQPDLEAIWADSSIQGIQVTTATNQHKEVLLAAAKAGKHIFTEKVLALTKDIVARQNITCLMVTHNMKNALELGNRTLMMDAGRIVLDIGGEERKGLTVEDLLSRFRAGAGKDLDNDRILLS